MQILLILLLCLVLSACTAAPSTIAYADVPQTGDPVRGEELFNTQVNLAPPCVACHIPANTASPTLDGFGAIAGSRVDGESAHEYAFYSITEPSRYIVEGFGDAMYNQYDENLTAQDIADLIAYILSR